MSLHLSQRIWHSKSISVCRVGSGQDTTVATGKSLLATIAEKFSLFVYNAGIKLFAAKGNVEVQAQSDSINLTAQKDINMQAVSGKITEVASDEITFSSGGAYIRLKGGNIELHAPGTIDVKGVQQLFDGPAGMSATLSRLPNALPVMPEGICVECMLRNLKRGIPLVDVT
ncbi:DUF2345 domain-containing protein [Zymobacter palmae]|uniref:DUF2345 domain-containing protein n=1 Tax=Zymobacter palmae TaxID=33074 RepID=UPI002D21A379|nr:DUF2345 domain-containing protein [Zymobacter palmae]